MDAQTKTLSREIQELRLETENHDSVGNRISKAVAIKGREKYASKIDEIKTANANKLNKAHQEWKKKFEKVAEETNSLIKLKYEEKFQKLQQEFIEHTKLRKQHENQLNILISKAGGHPIK